MKLPSLIISIALFIFPNTLHAQTLEEHIVKNDTIPYAKLYVHTDRELYFNGDSVWFKAYYLDGQTHQLVSGLYNLYVNLISDDGIMVQSQVLPLTNGVTSGYIPVHDDISPGNYIFRAYTDFQRVFGEDAYFHRTLSFVEAKSSLEQMLFDSAEFTVNQSQIDLAFLPEGGVLLAGQKNTVGLKAIDQDGKGISVRGVIVDSKERVAAFYSTTYKGMGKVSFVPRNGETYKVKVQNYPNYVSKTEKVIDEGIKLEFVRESSDEFFFKTVTNSQALQNQTYFFSILHHGRLIFHRDFVQSNENSILKIKASELPGGINRVVLSDVNLRPISERLIFSKNVQINKINVNLNKYEFETRSEIQLELADDELLSNHAFSSLSVAVIDKDAIVKGGSSTNIKSYLLLDSELKGNIDSPADFFIDEESISSDEKLNLLMLTQGWRKYIWSTSAINVAASNFKFKEGITISGSVQNLWSKKPVVNGDITLGLLKNGYMDTYVGTTDSTGKFSIDKVLFTEAASVFIQAKKKNGRLSTKLVLDPLFKPAPAISALKLQQTKVFSNISTEIYRQRYYAELATERFVPEEGAILLDEINITADKKKDDPISGRIYKKASTSLEVKEIDKSYPHVLTYLQARVPGLRIVSDAGGYQVTIRGSASFLLDVSPLVLINGMPGSIARLDEISMEIVERVEVYKDANELAMFGSRGSNGVIAVYTKEGVDFYEKPEAKGAISQTINGYAAYCEFYSPKYTSQNLNSKKPDHRVTLFWNPNVITQNRKAKLSFFSSDDLDSYKILIEGITSDGRICLGEAGFSVNEYNSSLAK